MRPLLFVSLFALHGCFVGYDSRWGQESKAQKHAAEAARPASLTPTTASKPATHVFKIRVWATPQYGAQTLDWKHETRAILDDANGILTAVASTRLEIASIETWAAPPSQEDLGVSLQGLAALDKGDDIGWVIGLVGSFPTYTSSFHQLGLTTVMGRHLVMRASGDLGEHEAIDALDKVDIAERSQLVAERKRHRSVSVLLHEVGHTLGLVHDEEAESFMGSTWSKKIHQFGVEAKKALAIGVAHRGEVDPHPFAADVLHYYEAATTPWVDKERTDLIGRLRAFTTPAPVASAPPPAKIPPELKEADRPVWTKTSESFQAGKIQEAWQSGAPLFKAYPDVLAVQDLRCQIAMKAGLAFQAVKHECERLMQLSTKK